MSRNGPGPTIHKMSPFDCISAMQKCIRRGMEREAYEFAIELINTSKAFTTMCCNRLEVISHEDCCMVADPGLIPFVACCCEQAKRHYNKDAPEKAWMMVASAIRKMCAAEKSRYSDEMCGSVGNQSFINGFVPIVPDWAYDHHTTKGRSYGRGIEYFRTESTKLDRPSAHSESPYTDEFYAMIELRKSGKPPGGGLFAGKEDKVLF